MHNPLYGGFLNEIPYMIIVGDIHRDFNYLSSLFDKVEGETFVQVGDFGLYNNEDEVREELEELNRLLRLTGNKLLAIRGNHDNPVWWERGLEFSNLFLLPDYTIIDGILFIGGAISVDRKVAKLWWQGEGVKEDIFLLHKAIDSYNGRVHTIISHSAPLYAPPLPNGRLVEYYAQNDPTLKEDLLRERKYLNKILEIVKPNKWFYGHFHWNFVGNYFETNFRCVASNDFWFDKNL